MFSDILRLSRHTIVYGSGLMLSRILAFILLPFFTHHLSPAEYGIYSLYYLAIALALEIIRLGQDIALLRFYVPEKDEIKRREVFSTVFYLALAVSTAAAGILWIGAEFWVKIIVKMPHYPAWATDTLKMCVLIIWMDNIAAFPLIVMRGEGRAWWFTSVKLVGAAAQLGLTIWFLVGLDGGVLGIFQANALSSGLALALTIPLIVHRLKPVFNGSILRDCIAFGLPNVPNLLFVVVIELSDRKILELFRGVEEAGLYAAGYRLGMFLAIVATGFRFAWQPFFLQLAERSDAQVVYARVLTYYLAFSVWLYLLLTALVDPLVRWSIPGNGRLIAPEYWQGLKVFPVVLLAHLFNGVHAVMVVGIYILKRTRVLPLMTGIAAGVNLGGNLLLVPRYGMWASAWLTVVSYALMAALLFIYIQPRYPIPWEWRRIFHLTAAAAVCFGLGKLTLMLGYDWPAWTLAVGYPLLLLATGMTTPGELRRLKIQS